MKKNWERETAVMRRGENECGEERRGVAARGSSFFSCHPFNCFPAVVTMTRLQGEQSRPRALMHSQRRAAAEMTLGFFSFFCLSVIIWTRLLLVDTSCALLANSLHPKTTEGGGGIVSFIKPDNLLLCSMSETLVIFYIRDAIIFGYSVNPTIGYALFASVNCKQRLF